MAQNRNKKYDEAYDLYNSGLSLSGVAEKIGVTRQGIYKAFKLRGFKLREVEPQKCQYFDGKKFTLRTSGYYALSNSGRIMMHRYVWSFYNGSIPKWHDIHHIDKNRANNDISNLKLLSKDAHTKLHSIDQKRKKVIMMDAMGKEIKTFESLSIAASEFGIHSTAIVAAIHGRSKTCVNHKWKYANN